MIREPSVAGYFYPFTQKALCDSIEECFKYWKINANNLRKKAQKHGKGVRGAVIPHAGYQYSGYVAASVYAKLAEKFSNTYIIIGPNHSGIGPDASVYSEGSWKTPMGEVQIDDKLAKKLVSNSKFLEADTSAHAREHSIEVQLPFLQYLNPDFKIVPICLKHYFPDENFLKMCNDFGNSISKSMKTGTIIASSDLTHYESQDSAVSKDLRAIEDIEKMDVESLFNTIAVDRTTACGYGGIASMMIACKKLGKKKAEKVSYMTSGDVTKDYSGVVGYGGILVD